ncbi:MAG: hypothetical protein U1E36_03665 [Rickettsiales bacterium]
MSDDLLNVGGPNSAAMFASGQIGGGGGGAPGGQGVMNLPAQAIACLLRVNLGTAPNGILPDSPGLLGSQIPGILPRYQGAFASIANQLKACVVAKDQLFQDNAPIMQAAIEHAPIQEASLGSLSPGSAGGPSSFAELVGGPSNDGGFGVA